MPADRAARQMTADERLTWSWYARWATIVRAFAVAEREGVPGGPERLRRARQLLDPHTTDKLLDGLIAHHLQREAAGERGLFDPPRLIDLVGPAMAQRIVDAGWIEGAVAEREQHSAHADRSTPAPAVGPSRSDR